jgi:hypothetical protein
LPVSKQKKYLKKGLTLCLVIGEMAPIDADALDHEVLKNVPVHVARDVLAQTVLPDDPVQEVQ